MSMTWRSLILVAGLGGCLAAQGLPPTQVMRPGPVMLPPGTSGAAARAGGVAPNQTVTTGPLALSLGDAIERGLRDNLAPLLAGDVNQEAAAQRLAAWSALLPQVDASAGEEREKLNLAAFDFSLPGMASIVGPFGLFQASAAAHVPVLDLGALASARAARTLETAAHGNYEATRDLVVLAVANQYLLTVADQSRVTAAQAELDTATTALKQAQDMLEAGTVDALAAVRAQVQRDRQTQQLTAQQNALAKQRLQLARAIGLPLEQPFTLASAADFEPLAVPDAATAVAQALANRPDYHAAEAVEKAARLLVTSARDQSLPTVSLDGNYGTIGHEITSNHPIYSVGASVQLPIFAGGLFKADRLRAEAQLRDATGRLTDLRAQIAVQVRAALLDLDSNQAQVAVARDARGLAARELTLAQDRFKAGVADNLEVVQAQQEVADANESYIASLYGYNLAKATLAQALGVAASGYQRYLPVQ